MQCPQCGAHIPDQEWNCPVCRINVYWASQHYEDLVGIRHRHGLPTAPDTPAFLRRAHLTAMEERARRGRVAEPKVRKIARMAMRGRAPVAMAASLANPAQGDADPRR